MVFNSLSRKYEEGQSLFALSLLAPNWLEKS